MIIEFMDERGNPTESRQIAFDGAQEGIDDVVLVNIAGGVANLILDETIVADYTTFGVVDHFSYDGKAVEFSRFL